MRLKGRIAVVTGAAGGMGRGAALKLAAEGAVIEVLDRQEAAAACDEIRKAGGVAGTQAHSQEEAFNRVMMNQAIKKRGTPEHLANLIAFLASDEAEMITGQFMLADGGGYLH